MEPDGTQDRRNSVWWYMAMTVAIGAGVMLPLFWPTEDSDGVVVPWILAVVPGVIGVTLIVIGLRRHARARRDRGEV